jgi:CheY-like chemotaxis protein/HPt (histidine-containing phosphotransfer) domain-containing protein
MLDLEAIPFDVRLAVSEVSELLGGAARERGLDLRATVHPDVPLTLLGDPGRLRQILVNLVSNAVKFTERGSVAVSVDMLERSGPMVTVAFRVTDTGIGVPASNRAMLFRPFTQADSTTTRRYGGTGLGLAICKKLVELMGGEIGLESVEGQGSSFWITLRLQSINAPDRVLRPWREQPPEVSEQPVEPPAVRPGPPEADRPGIQVLLVEDHPVNQRVTVRMLERLGYTPTVVENGRLAVEAVERRRYDLVVMDCQMPEMDGYAATREIRQREADGRIPSGERRMPIIAMTASAMAGDRERCLESGMDDYLTKPVNSEALRTMLRRWTMLSQELDPRAAEARIDGPGGQMPMTTPDELLARVDVLSVLDASTVAALRDPDLGGDDAFLVEVIQAFLDDSPRHVQAVQQGFAASDAEVLMRAAHSLKGSCGNFGAARLHTLCAALEGQARADHLEGLAPLVARLPAEYASLAEQLAALAADARTEQTAPR